MVLEGMKVLSFCHYLQGPAAMQYLADMGADVIKVEPPGGAFERHWAGAGKARAGDVSALYLCANRNVRSVSLDLKHSEAAVVIDRLIGRSHVLAENFRPGTLERLGFGYERVRTIRPEIIYASASGFGATGPYAHLPGQDLMVQAMSGLASVGGDGRTPVPAGVTAVDQHGAALMALAIAGAYCRYLATGKGTRIEANLLGAAIDLQGESIVTYFASALGKSAFARDSHLATWFHEAPYGIYPIADGHIAFSLTSLEALSTALSLPELCTLDAFTDRDRVARLTAEAVAHRRFAELSAALNAHHIWHTKVAGYDDLLDNPQVRHNGAIQEIEVAEGRKARLVSHPIRYDGTVPGVRHMALRPGADTEAVLEEAGFSAAERSELVRNRVVFPAEVTA